MEQKQKPNTYIVIQPMTDEKDNSIQLEEVFGSKYKPEKKQLSNDLKMENIRGFDRSNYNPSSEVTSPIEKIFNGSLNFQEESYNGYHQNVNNAAYMNQDIRWVNISTE